MPLLGHLSCLDPFQKPNLESFSLEGGTWKAHFFSFARIASQSCCQKRLKWIQFVTQFNRSPGPGQTPVEHLWIHTCVPCWAVSNTSLRFLFFPKINHSPEDSLSSTGLYWRQTPQTVPQGLRAGQGLSCVSVPPLSLPIDSPEVEAVPQPEPGICGF